MEGIAWRGDERSSGSSPRSAVSGRNALLGWVVIGLPCLLYAVRGRGTILEDLTRGAELDPSAGDDGRAPRS